MRSLTLFLALLGLAAGAAPTAGTSLLPGVASAVCSVARGRVLPAAVPPSPQPLLTGVPRPPPTHPQPHHPTQSPTTPPTGAYAMPRSLQATAATGVQAAGQYFEFGRKSWNPCKVRSPGGAAAACLQPVTVPAA